MGKIIEALRNLVQMKMLFSTILGRYWRIINNLAKLTFKSIILIGLSINYLASLIIIPAGVFAVTYLISKDVLLSALLLLIAAVIYIIIMSNYFSKGVHKFGVNAQEIKQYYHSIKMEHKLIIRSLRDDSISGLVFMAITLIIALEFVAFYYIFYKFGVVRSIKDVILVLILIQIFAVLGEYLSSGLIKVKLPKFKGKKKHAEHVTDKMSSKPMDNDGFEELIVLGDANGEEKSLEEKKPEGKNASDHGSIEYVNLDDKHKKLDANEEE